MIRSSPSCPTPIMRNPPKSSKLSWSSQFIFAAMIVGGAAVAMVLSGCAGRNVHPELGADTHVLTRAWTLPTHGPFEAGDRGFEYSNPVMVENALIFGNQSTGLVSLYPGMVQVRWSLPIRGGVVSEVAVDHA